MTFNDYPKAAVEAARRGIELNEKNGGKCATRVGKIRAKQLVNGQRLSLDTIQRMRAFLIRQKSNFRLAQARKDYNACGYISYLLWGGEAALPWAEKKIRQAGQEFKFFEDEETILEAYEESNKKSMTIVFLSCSKSKQDYKCQAQELYSASPMFTKTLEYGKKLNPDSMYILSAKHHLVEMEDELEPYDLTLKEFTSEEKQAWGGETYRQMVDKGMNGSKDKFIFLAGTEYINPLLEYIPEVNIEEPLEGKRFGERLSWLNANMRALFSKYFLSPLKIKILFK
jgi:hypothetical protein